MVNHRKASLRNITAFNFSVGMWVPLAYISSFYSIKVLEKIEDFLLGNKVFQIVFINKRLINC